MICIICKASFQMSDQRVHSAAFAPRRRFRYHSDMRNSRLRNSVRTILIGGLGLIAFASPASADAIDGTWCSPAGERVTIKGEDVLTPGGNRVKGAYTRHSMVFQIPPQEVGAGKKLYMEQLNDTTVKVTTIAEVQVEPGPHEDWKRCQPNVS